jgi:putative transcriptional regulator
LKPDYPGSFKGQLLVAMPLLADPNFHKTVTCICDHDISGALGIIINRPDITLKGRDIFSELGIEFVKATESVPIYMGGPVHMNEIFILHGPPFGWEGCLPITATLAMSNTLDILKSIALGEGPEHFIISLGCAGWGSGQLEVEIQENSWLTSRMFESALFKWEAKDRWKKVLDKNGIDPMGLSHTAGHA